MISSVCQTFLNRSSQLFACISANSASLQCQQHRGIVMVRRLFPAAIPKQGRSVKKLKRSHRVYVLEEDTQHRPREKLRLILTQDVPNTGIKGEVVMVDKRIGRNKLLPAGAAVYASPDNLLEFALSKQKEREESKEHPRLTPMALRTIEHLKKNRLIVRMHTESTWDVVTIQHVVNAFRRRLGVVVPEHALTLPEDPITELGTYNISVTINGMETVPMEMDVIEYVPKMKKNRMLVKDPEKEVN